MGMARPGLLVKGLVFDMYGTLVDAGAVAEACRELAPDPIAFNNQWRAKQLEYTFLRTLMGQYRDFWTVTGEALAFAVARFALEMTAEQRQRLMAAWLLPTPYPEVATALPRLKATHLLAVLSNGTPEMLRSGLEQTALWPHFTSVLSADSVQRYKPSPEVYQLALQHTGLLKDEILFVSSNSWDVLGAKSFGFNVCWINRTGVLLDTLGLSPDLVVTNVNELVEAL